MRSLNLEIQVNSLKLFTAFTFLYFQGAPSHRLNAVRWFPRMRLEFKTNYYNTFLFHFFINTFSFFLYLTINTITIAGGNVQASVRVGDLVLSEQEEFQVKITSNFSRKES